MLRKRKTLQHSPIGRVMYVSQYALHITHDGQWFIDLRREYSKKWQHDMAIPVLRRVDCVLVSSIDIAGLCFPPFELDKFTVTLPAKFVLEL